MKKIIIILFTAILLLNLVSCAAKEAEYNITDALKISAWVFDENSGKDYFIYHESTDRFSYNLDDDVYVFDRLKMNEVRLLPPLLFGGLKEMVNLNIFFEFADGFVEVISEDQDVQLSVNNPLEPFYLRESSGRTYGFDIKVPYEGYITLHPFGGSGHIMGGAGIGFWPHKIGREYYLTVNTYKFANEKSTVITARLRIVELEDKDYMAAPFNKTSCFSIELISYEYSDMYKMMYDIDEDYE